MVISNGEKVLEELRSKEFTDEQLSRIGSILDIKGNTAEKLAFLREYFSNSPIGLKGVEEIEKVCSVSAELGIQDGELELDLTLARGLDYYTGCIFEVKITDSGMGSISGGGRYDDLTGIFGMPGLSGVGISFGADRIYDILQARQLFPAFNENKIQFLFLNFGEAEAMESLKIVHALRKKQIKAALYPDEVKIKKQMGYANDIGAAYVCTIGSEELKNGTLGLKNMQTGEQVSLSVLEFKEKYLL